eukprot:scaffold177277_cov42-Prasinocladus_malaysianus.AAC.1
MLARHQSKLSSQKPEVGTAGRWRVLPAVADQASAGARTSTHTQSKRGKATNYEQSISAGSLDGRSTPEQRSADLQADH